MLFPLLFPMKFSLIWIAYCGDLSVVLLVSPSDPFVLLPSFPPFIFPPVILNGLRLDLLNNSSVENLVGVVWILSTPSAVRALLVVRIYNVPFKVKFTS